MICSISLHLKLFRVSGRGIGLFLMCDAYGADGATATRRGAFRKIIQFFVSVVNSFHFLYLGSVGIRIRHYDIAQMWFSAYFCAKFKS